MQCWCGNFALAGSERFSFFSNYLFASKNKTRQQQQQEGAKQNKNKCSGWAKKIPITKNKETHKHKDITQ